MGRLGICRVTFVLLISVGLFYLAYMMSKSDENLEDKLKSNSLFKLSKYSRTTQNTSVKQEIHIVTNYALMTESPWKDNQTSSDISSLRERQSELDEVLQRNIDNPLVRNVHLLINQESARNRLLTLPLGKNKHKIRIKRIPGMPKYRDFFAYINERLLNSLVIFMNMDIYLGEGFEKINKTFLLEKNVCYAPTRHGRKELRCDMSGKKGYCGNGYGGSHDTFIFVLRERFTRLVISELDYSMNVLGAENVLLYLLKNRLGMQLLNPCQYLKTYHSHCIRIHGNFRPRINNRGGNKRKSAVVQQSGRLSAIQPGV